jgi:type I restriction enzyme S subunit
LISAAGTIGRTIVYNGEDSYFQDSNIVWIENNKNLISNELFYHILQIAKFNTEGGTIQRLYNSILKSKKIAIPPTKTEQTAIANALSDVDGYIESLEKLIAKKQKIKQGAMQQLLKPQPHWEVKKLGELCSITTGKLDANAMVENGKYRFYTCAKEFYFINEYAFETEALLVSGNGANVGYIHYYNGKFNAYQRTYVMDEFDENILFIKYHLEFDLHKRISIEKNEGNTPYIVMSTLTEMMINLPNKDEQKEISQTLSNIDSEITTLNQKLTKAKDLKQGMMQQLLTGKIRLL